tara:strand:- start:998 stop:1990 length:993 start_codon:yes stop_codon:yes gene_type:complete
MNQFIDKEYRITYNIEDLSNKHTVLDNLKTKSFSQLTKELTQKNSTKALNIAVELVFSGYYDAVITKIVEFYIKNINMAQPRGVLYISSFYLNYNSRYDKKERKTKKLELINEQFVRNFINNLISLICGSNQRRLPILDKIAQRDFNLSKNKHRLVSKNLDLVAKYITATDNKNIIIPLSEIITLLSGHTSDRLQKIVYWISWLFEYDKVYHKGKLEINYRTVDGIGNKYSKDYIWIIWEMLKDSILIPDIKQYITSLEVIYKQDFTTTSRKRKLPLLIFAMSMHINPLPKLQIPIPFLPKDLLRTMQYETLTVNIRYYALKKKIQTMDL